jgi:hypothetical protein
VRVRGLVFGVLRGLKDDEEGVALEAIGALGHAFLISGAVPQVSIIGGPA